MARFIKFLYLILLFLTPIIFCPLTSELFEFPKIIFLYAVTAIIVGLHLTNALSKRVPLLRFSSLNFPLILFFLSQCAATIFSIDRHTSIFGYYSRFNGGLVSILCYTLLYLILIVYIDDKFRQNIIKTSLFSGFIVALYGLAQHFGIDSHYWVQDVQSRVFSTLGQPNWLAAYLCLLIPFSLFQLIQSKNLINRFLFTGFSITYFICLLFTKSKTGLIASAISLFVFFLFYITKEKTKKSISISISTAIIVLILSLTINNPIKDIFFKTTNPAPVTPNSTINITPSENIRKLVWQGAFELWLRYPFFGTGTETFAYSYYWTRPAAHNLTSEWDFLYNKAHNEYLNYLATTGTFGILSYLVFIIFVLILFLKKQTFLSFTLLASYISILITNATGFSVVITSIYFFILPALIYESNQPPADHKINKIASIPIFIISLLILLKIWSYFQADINYNVADSYLNQSYYADALEKINTAINLFPNEPTYYIKQADILTKNALLSQQQKNSRQAMDYATQALTAGNLALAISPASVNLYKEQAQNYYYLSTIKSDYFLLAIDAITKATRLAPTDAKSYYILGKFWSTISKDDLAIQAYQKAIELKSNYDYATFALGEIYFTQKNYPEAKKYFQDTLKIAPNNTDAQNYLSKITKL